MPPRRVVVGGATGFIGTALVDALRAHGVAVTRLVRAAPGPDDVLWRPAEGELDGTSLRGADAVVNLAGAPIAGARWTSSHKADILRSRLESTTTLVAAIASLPPGERPATLLNGSAVGFYGDRGDEFVDESCGQGGGFLADVCGQWEAAAAPVVELGTRLVLCRTGVVLAAGGGALKPQLLAFRLGLGGRLGPGTQYLPWITLDDAVNAMLHALWDPSLNGPVNVVAPNPVTNGDFTRALGAALHRPTVLPIPLVVLRARFGSELVDEMLLAGQRARPSALQRAGFVFASPDLAPALHEML